LNFKVLPRADFSPDVRVSSVDEV
jgi:hypothetical protein